MRLIFQYSWALIVLVVLANAAFWRIEARHRINSDPSLRRPLNRLYGGFAFWLSLPFLVMGVGIVFGETGSAFAYLRLDFTNLFVAAFHIVVVTEYGLFAYWVFFAGGADQLALHTELLHARPKFRLGARVLAGVLPLQYVGTMLYTTFSPHFGQLAGAIGV